MKLDQQVCSLELAKRLKELGVEQESYFYWILETSGNWGLTTVRMNEPKNQEWLKKRGDFDGGIASVIAGGLVADGLEKTGYKLEDLKLCYAAFTVAELLEMLPERTAVFQHLEEWTCEHFRLHENEELRSHNDFKTRNTAANACAASFIDLIEKKLVTP